MNNTVIVKLMTNLINKKFYPTKEESVEKTGCVLRNG